MGILGIYQLVLLEGTFEASTEFDSREISGWVQSLAVLTNLAHNTNSNSHPS